jgi:hypothetical protein
MASLNTAKLVSDMSAAAISAAGNNWGTMRNFAQTELQKLAAIAVEIEVAKKAGTITEDEAATLVEMQKNATRAVLLGIEGIGLLVAEATVNAVIGVLKGAINTATGFALL